MIELINPDRDRPLWAALGVLFQAADDGILPEASYADLARVRIALARATLRRADPDPGAPCPEVF